MDTTTARFELAGTTYRARTTYPLLRAWDRMMGSDPGYTRDGVKLAAQHGAPERAIYRKGGLPDGEYAWAELEPGHAQEERLAKLGLAHGYLEPVDALDELVEA